MFQIKALLFFTFLLCSPLPYTNGETTVDPEAEISLGKIKGSILKTRLGKPIYSFRGIKYAKPPTGEKRFKPSEPVDPWTGVYDASQEGPSCPNPNGKNISEDCLVLNVYTTKLPSKNNLNKSEKRPVIVFIHGGGLSKLSSQSSIVGPQYLMDQNVVLVTVNYRLSSLGFISTGDHYAPGNLGFKDQVVALKWVKKNIAAFGGDPDSVTLTGQSAGARSALLHMLSPMSKGLFHRMIALSGSPTMSDPLPHHQKNLAIKQAKILNCTTENMDKMFECLREKPAKEFGNSVGKFAEWQSDPIFVWYPVIEPEIPGVERFLTDQPADLIRSGNYNQVPIFMGVTQDEFGFRNIRAIELAMKGDNSTFIDLNKNWEKISPISFLYERDTKRSKHISRELFKFSFHDKPISLNNSIGRANLYADGVTIFPVHRAALLFAAASQKPVYFYQFAYQGRYSYAHWKNGTNYGVVHQDDLIYIMYRSDMFPMFKSTDPEVRTVERMTSMWANFAKTGYPIPSKNSLFQGVTWTKLTPKNEAYLEITENLTMKSNLYPDRMQLWESLFPLKAINSNRNGV